MRRKIGKRHRNRNLSFGIMVILSVLVVSFCMTETVMSQSRADRGRERQYYAGMEKEYYAGMRELLTEKGYRNSGITIRWVSEEEGGRSYTVMIHHRKLTQLTDTGKEELLRELAETEFQDAGCTFYYEFLMF
ncbi:MAG: hypothetical protein NC341_03435 [Blautia sp.]|nr:hypothetical protein [Blautia sp.]MCM1202194.1 hypothetical protein [Bacteroides fragilis]